MALRSIDQRYWTDPYVESLSATEKLVYIHLFSSAHTNLVGVFQASRRMIAFQTACPGPDVDTALERFRRDGKAIIDGGEVWLVSYIRHQCTSSPKMVAAMRGQLAKVESDTIRKGIVTRYPHIMEPSGPRPPKPNAYGVDTVSVSSRYKIREKDKISAALRLWKARPRRPRRAAPPRWLSLTRWPASSSGISRKWTMASRSPEPGTGAYCAGRPSETSCSFSESGSPTPPSPKKTTGPKRAPRNRRSRRSAPARPIRLSRCPRKPSLRKIASVGWR